METGTSVLTETLLPPQNLRLWTPIPLLVTVTSSAVGMLALKYAQVHGSVQWLCVGYTCEAIAFLLYPLNFVTLPLQVVVVMWSATSNVTAFLGGVYLYGERVTSCAVVGCILNVLGVGLVSYAQIAR